MRFDDYILSAIAETYFQTKGSIPEPEIEVESLPDETFIIFAGAELLLNESFSPDQVAQSVMAAYEKFFRLMPINMKVAGASRFDGGRHRIKFEFLH